MTAVRKNTNFLRTSLISVVSAATLASAAAAMPAAETSSPEVETPANAEVVEPEINAETLILTEPQSPAVAEINANPNVAVFPRENAASVASIQANTFPIQTNSSFLAPFNNTSLLKSTAFDRENSPSQLPDVVETKQSILPTQTKQLRVAEIEPNSKETVTAQNTAAPQNSQTRSSAVESDTRLQNGTNRSKPKNPLAQVTSVSQLSDVQPTDWAFQALQSLVERYGCIEGYPDRTFRGNRAMTRYEFAAGLNACLEKIQELISSVKPSVSEADLNSLRRLQQEFAAELATLRGRVDSLEARTAKLEATQFSTTSRLLGNIRFQTNAYFSGEGDTETIFQHIAYLGILTSFTGRDLLLTGIGITNTVFPDLATTNAGKFVGSTREGAADASASGDTGDAARIITLQYQFPLTDKINVNVIAGNRYRFDPLTARRFLPYYQVGNGPASTFAEAPPIYLLGGGAGLAIDYEMFKGTVLTLTYISTFANEPGSKAGLFNGDYVASAQINYNPVRKFFLQGVYQNGYFGTRTFPDGQIGNFGFNNGQFFRGNGFIGSALANRFDDPGVLFDEASAVSTNAYHVGGYYEITPKFVIGGWVDYIKARLIGKGDADIWTYSAQVAFPDLFKQGNLGGLVVGMEPTLTGFKKGDRYVGTFDNDTSLHIEAYYRYQVNNNISVTPSVIWITAPNQDADNEDIVIGGVRTTFNF
ncbi:MULTISPECIES: iron uptake porin [Oscillatoriales]|nr:MULTISPECIES: iron uptake porin [Oscillatoriales]